MRRRERLGQCVFAADAHGRIWPFATLIALQRYFRNWGRSGHARTVVKCEGGNLVTPRSSAAARSSSSGSLAKFAAMRWASSRVSRLVAERRCGSVCPDCGANGGGCSPASRIYRARGNAVGYWWESPAKFPSKSRTSPRQRS